MRMLKKQVDLPNGYVLRPIAIGESAYLDDGRQQLITSKVVSVNETVPGKLVIETLNTVYTINKAI